MKADHSAKLSIKDWAEADRPREKMLSKGVAVLTDAELLAILIGSGNASESAVQLSQRILHSMDNNLNKLGKLSIKELISNYKGIGEAKAITIKAAMELGKRWHAAQPQQLALIRTSLDAFQLFHPILCDLPHEELWIALTNQAGRVIEKQRISQGGISGTVADLRLILREAIQAMASGIFLFHNHPSGNLQPSAQDDSLTQRLQQSAKLMEIRLLDHIIISNHSYYSYADEGRMG